MKFAASCLKSDRFGWWFPVRGGRVSARSKVPYLENFARCQRLYNSPVFFMRRRLNGKEGKKYGERNRARREDGYVGGCPHMLAWMGKLCVIEWREEF